MDDCRVIQSDIGKNVSLFRLQSSPLFHFFVICMQFSARVKYFLFGTWPMDPWPLAIITPALIGASIEKMDQGSGVAWGTGSKYF